MTELQTFNHFLIRKLSVPDLAEFEKAYNNLMYGLTKPSDVWLYCEYCDTTHQIHGTQHDLCDKLLQNIKDSQNANLA